MQLAAEPAAFLRDGRDGLAAGLDEVLGERPGAQRLGQQRDGQPQHLLVAGGERQVARPQPHHQLPGAVEVEGPGVGGLGARDRERYAVDHQRGVRHDQRLADRPQRDERVLADPAGHGGGGAQRVRALAEQQLVDHAAQDHAGGLVRRRRQRGEQPQRAGVEVIGPEGVEQGELENEDRHHRDQGDRGDHRGDHEAPDVDQVGQRGTDVHRGPDQGEHRGRERRHGATGDALGREGGEEVQEPGHGERQGHPDQGPALAVLARPRSATRCGPGETQPCTSPISPATSGLAVRRPDGAAAER